MVRKIHVQDYNPLIWLDKNTGTKLRILRWAFTLKPFNYKVVHKKGITHQIADSLTIP